MGGSHLLFQRNLSRVFGAWLLLACGSDSEVVRQEGGKHPGSNGSSEMNIALDAAVPLGVDATTTCGFAADCVGSLASAPQSSASQSFTAQSSTAQSSASPAAASASAAATVSSEPEPRVPVLIAPWPEFVQTLRVAGDSLYVNRTGGVARLLIADGSVFSVFRTSDGVRDIAVAGEVLYAVAGQVLYSWTLDGEPIGTSKLPGDCDRLVAEGAEAFCAGGVAAYRFSAVDQSWLKLGEPKRPGFGAGGIALSGDYFYWSVGGAQRVRRDGTGAVEDLGNSYQGMAATARGVYFSQGVGSFQQLVRHHADGSLVTLGEGTLRLAVAGGDHVYLAFASQPSLSWLSELDDQVRTLWDVPTFTALTADEGYLYYAESATNDQGVVFSRIMRLRHPSP
jgi:hypothetical protein